MHYKSNQPAIKKASQLQMQLILFIYRRVRIDWFMHGVRKVRWDGQI